MRLRVAVARVPAPGARVPNPGCPEGLQRRASDPVWRVLRLRGSEPRTPVTAPRTPRGGGRAPAWGGWHGAPPPPPQTGSRESPTWVGTARPAAQSCSPTASAAQKAVGTMGAGGSAGPLRPRATAPAPLPLAPLTESESRRAAKERRGGGAGRGHTSSPPHTAGRPAPNPPSHPSSASLALGPYLQRQPLPAL